MEQNELTVLNPEIAVYDDDTIFAIAEKAERRVEALNKIMNAALKITSGYDWTIIGGKPYLQESGATKVARLFGISWRIINIERKLDEGYPAFSYTMEFTLGNTKVEAIGARSGKDEFFTGKDRTKKPDAVDANDVEKSAFTNCLNRGIKSILPGLRNLDVAALEAAGIKAGSGYTFRTTVKESGFKCSKCDAAVTQQEASYSQGKMGAILCRKCQKEFKQ